MCCIQTEQLAIVLLGKFAVSCKKISQPQLIMTFRVVRVEPDRLAVSFNRLAVSPNGLIRIPEVSETHDSLRIDPHRFLKVVNCFIITAILGVHYSDIVMRQPVSLDHSQGMIKQDVTVLPVANLF